MTGRACVTAAGGALLLAAAGLAFAQPGGFAASVEVTRVKAERLRETQEFVGTVQPRRTSKVGSAVSGRVDDFPVNEGDRVNKGQTLAQLKTAIVAAELATARAVLDVRRAELVELEKSTPVEQKQAKARLDMKEAMFKFLLAKRARAFSAAAAVSREDLEQSTALADEAQAALRDAQAQIDMLGEPRQSKIAQGRAQVAAAEAEVERLAEQLDRYTVKAPFDGYVVHEYTEAGEWLLQGDKVAEVADLDVVEVEVPVLEDYVSHVLPGQKVPVVVSALPGEAFEGTVCRIVPKANERSRTFPVKIEIPNRFLDEEKRHVLLRAGMFARVRLPVSEGRQALLVPRDALVLSGRSRVVYAVDPADDGKAGTARPVPVELGLSQGDWVEASGDLKAGQVIVSRGNERLRPGQAVTMLWVEKQAP